MHTALWAKAFKRGTAAITRLNLRVGKRVVSQAIKRTMAQHQPPQGVGSWVAGLAMGTTGTRRFQLYCPPDMKAGERLALIVMLHGCGQDAKSFAMSTRMNRAAAREHFMVLYPEQNRLVNAQGCWNWFDTSNGRADADVALILKAIEQVCLSHPVDPARIVAAGFSAGASMAALLGMAHPECFKAVVMHSGIAPGTAHSSMSALSAMRGRRATKALSVLPAALSLPPLLVIHGAGDLIVSPTNGQAAAQVWADAGDARAGQARQVQRGKRHAMTVTDYKHQGRTLATLVEVAHMGHAWSGGAASESFSDAHGPDASRMVWAFAAKQFASFG